MQRYWQVDFARGMAIILMLLFNYAFALSFLGIFYLDAGWLFWFLFPRLIGGAFIIIAGVSLMISISRQKRFSRRKYFLRGGKLFAIGIAISAVTWLLFPSVFIVFGILHLIGISVILGVFLRKMNLTLLIAGAALVVLGIIANSMTISQPFLVWLGLPFPGFATLDYFPLLPWFGVFLAGMFFGRVLVEKKLMTTKMPFFSKSVCFIGRHSLLIYILHQPVLLLALFVLGIPVAF